MANTADIRHTLKTGADEALYLTPLSLDAGTLNLNSDKAFKARMIGESIQGAVETLDSNELKSGRNPSKKKLGNESSEGSLDFEFSPGTFDLLLESAFRGSFVADDTNMIKCQVTDGETHNEYKEGGYEKAILGADGLLDLAAANYSIEKLEVGTNDLEFDVLRKLGGADGEDLWQRYKHMKVNTFDIDVSTNSIVTGSFGFMGIDSPLRLPDADIVKDYGGEEKSQFVSSKVTGAEFVEQLKETSSSDEDQFVSTCGNLWINGQNITWSENVSISLNNNYERKNAIMVKKAISTTANRLDITGNYQSYVVKGKSEPVYNDAVKNNTVEIMFLLQDKEEDPNFIYLFQVRHAAFDAPSSSNNGTDSYEDTLSWSSFDEDPIAIYKITKKSSEEIPNVTDAAYDTDTETLTWTDATETAYVIVDAYDNKGNLVDRERKASGTETYTLPSSLSQEAGWYFVITNYVNRDDKYVAASGVKVVTES